MDTFLAENPKTGAYIVYLSVVIVIVSLLALFYYTRSQEYLSVIKKIKTEKIRSNKPVAVQPPIAKKDETLEEEDGFTIIDA